MPSIVKPVTQETPENAPKMTTTKIAKTKFCSSERMMSKNPALVSAAPNSRRRENWAKIFGPRAIPVARPVKTAPKRTPYAASPPARSPTNVRANPITAPAATNAPRSPTISPRTIFEDETNFPPSSRELIMDPDTSLLLRCSFGISS